MNPSRVMPAAALLLAAACAPAASPAAAPSSTAEPAAAPVAAAPGPDKAAIEACLTIAGAKRARSTTEPAKVGAKHVLVKYKGARSADAKISRTREEACLRAIEARDKVRGGADFAEVVKQFSDEAGAATRDGSVGAVERKELAKPFADAAFELSVNQVSDVVETEFGFHVILRTE